MIPKVSIIMPSLNVGLYIKEAIESVRNQSLEEIEIISIDAGSTDGTKEIIEEQAKTDSRIKIIDSSIKSYGHQVNIGIEAAKGEYVAILETDDYVEAGMYEKLFNIASSMDLDYIKSDYDAYITDAGKRCFTRRKLSDNRDLYKRAFIPIDYPVDAADDSYLWNGIYKLSFLHDNGIKFSETPGASFQDVGFLHKVKAHAKKVIYTDESFYRYCTDREGASSNSGKSLRFLRQEYGLLLNEVSLMSSEEQRLLFVRMARAFSRAAMESSESFLETEEARDICEWYRTRVKEAESNHYVGVQDIPSGLKETFNHLITSPEDYVEFRKKRKYELEQFIKNSSKIVVFGCGIYGREAEKIIASLGYQVSYFMDNGQGTWGTKVNGIEVVSPDRVSELPNDVGFIIANEKYRQEILSQLKSLKRDVNTYIY